MTIDKANILAVTVPQAEGMIEALRSQPRHFFLAPICRQYLAKTRFDKRGRAVRVHEDTSQGVMPGTVDHNKIQIEDGTFASARRTERLIGPLASLQRVYDNAATLRVLSIGPRTEMELMHLVGVGFRPENITGVDLISTSPWIDTGDMHALPYPDNSFDVVVSSWVLGYSRTPRKAMDEMVRVLATDGLIVIGATFNPRAAEVDYKDAEAKIVGTVFRSVNQYKDMLGDALARVYFEEDPDTDAAPGAVMLIGKIRK